jgi:hypothetical protein
MRYRAKWHFIIFERSELKVWGYVGREEVLDRALNMRKLYCQGVPVFFDVWKMMAH